MSAREKVTELLDSTGIEVGGGRPGDMAIHDERLFGRIMAEGSMGAGEVARD